MLSGVVWLGRCFFAACAAFSPLTAIVLSVAKGHEIGSEHEIDQFVEFVHLRIKDREFGALGVRGGAFGLAFFAFECVLLRSQSAGFSAADVFANHFSVDAFGPRVIAATFVPAHFCYTSRKCPAQFCYTFCKCPARDSVTPRTTAPLGC